jgi:hypothetical protein
MDAKEHQLVRDLARRLRNRTFHERDVLALLIVLREHTGPRSTLRELADFVAHREKDRGALQRYVKHVFDYLEALKKGTEARLRVATVHSPQEFCDSVNAALVKFDLVPLPRDVTDDAFVCVMSLLQEVRLIHNGSQIGGLSLGRLVNDLHLSGVVLTSEGTRVAFPALIIENKYCPRTSEFESFKGIVEARCTGSKLHLYIGNQRAA